MNLNKINWWFTFVNAESRFKRFTMIFSYFRIEKCGKHSQGHEKLKKYIFLSYEKS